jgi:NAD+ kinase
MLECAIGARKRDLALNDIIVTAGEKSRLVRLEVFADGELVTDYYSDGVIFSTPTGSTAYNLSAGGPILHPSARVVAMTPICPHTLSNRSIIFRESVRLRVRNGTEGAPLLVAVDGQRRYVAAPGAPVRISVARDRVTLAQRRDYAHFAVVRAKLKWTGGFAEKR